MRKEQEQEAIEKATKNNTKLSSFFKKSDKKEIPEIKPF
jgi:hypothetical protein